MKIMSFAPRKLPVGQKFRACHDQNLPISFSSSAIHRLSQLPPIRISLVHVYSVWSLFTPLSLIRFLFSRLHNMWCLLQIVSHWLFPVNLFQESMRQIILIMSFSSSDLKISLT